MTDRRTVIKQYEDLPYPVHISPPTDLARALCNYATAKAAEGTPDADLLEDVVQHVFLHVKDALRTAREARP